MSAENVKLLVGELSNWQRATVRLANAMSSITGKAEPVDDFYDLWKLNITSIQDLDSTAIRLIGLESLHDD